MKKEEEALTTLPSSLSSSFSNNIHSFIMNNDNYGSTTTTKSIKDLIIDLFARKMSFCEFNLWGGCLLYPNSFINSTNAENCRFLVSYTYEDWVNTVLSLDTQTTSTLKMLILENLLRSLNASYMLFGSYFIFNVFSDY